MRCVVIYLYNAASLAFHICHIVHYARRALMRFHFGIFLIARSLYFRRPARRVLVPQHSWPAREWDVAGRILSDSTSVNGAGRLGGSCLLQQTHWLSMKLRLHSG